MEHMNMKLNGESPPAKKKCKAWRKKTKLERYLIIISIVIFVAFLVMIGMVLYLEHVYRRSQHPICDTAVCKAQAGKIMSYMDFDVNPCEDFYNFACGSFSKVMIAPSNLNRYGSFYFAAERVRKLSTDLLEKEQDSEELDFVKKMRQYYKSCLKLDSDASEIIEEVLNKTELSHWPILEHDVYEENGLSEKAISIVVVNGGVNPYFHLSAGSNVSVGELWLGFGDVFGTEDKFLNDTEEACIRSKERYRKMIIYVLYKAGTLLEAIDSEVEELLQFETTFANITKFAERENETETTLNELADKCKEIGWLDILKHIYDYFGHSTEYRTDFPIKTHWSGYLDDLCKLFADTKPRTIYNYLVWRFLASKLRKLDPYFGKSYNEMMGYDDYQSSVKSDRCFNSLCSSSFVYALNYLVINHLQPDKLIEEVKEYDKEIKEVMNDMFSAEDWLDETSKDIAKRKLWNISGEIGYSKNSLDVGLLEKYFYQLNVSESHVENLLNDERRNVRKYMFNDTIRMENEIEIPFPLIQNAYFAGDKYVLTLGILQPPFYAYGAPKYLKYSVIPFVIAHELSHAYDDLELQKESDNSTDSWTEETLEEFKTRLNCYVDQYSQYPLDDNGTMVDGNQTIRDNIADNSGVVQAMMAYEKYALSKGEEPWLPGLDYTNEQLMLINYAQIWCETVKDAKKEFKYDSHSPGRYRVLVPFRNSPRFSEVFNCPIGSPMNPKDKCRMWG